jgi:DNA-binding NtrC family response regulator
VATKIKRAGQPKILVVDEDEQVRTSVEKVLEVKQVQVTTTARVDQALHLIDTESECRKLESVLSRRLRTE